MRHSILSIYRNHKITLALICLLAATAIDETRLRMALTANEFAQTKVIYNQTEQADQEIIDVIRNAKVYVYFAVYTMTRRNIVDALIAAKLRGLQVKGLLDFNQSIIKQEKPLISELKRYGVVLKIPFKATGIMHMKMVVTDNAYASGSFNWTTSASSINDEVLEIGHVRAIHDQYLKVFEKVYAKYEASKQY